MSDVQVVLHGWVGQEVALRKTGRGDVATFRVGTTPRAPDGRGGFKDGETVWTSVQCWRGLAQNVSASVHVGDPVVVIGKVRTNRWTTDSGELRQRSYVHATTVGHDLVRGTSVFRKTPRQHTPDDDGVIAEALDAAESLPVAVDPVTGEVSAAGPSDGPARIRAVGAPGQAGAGAEPEEGGGGGAGQAA